jgi:site-specific DNA-methyltransferase (adenine-specific)
MELLHLKNQFYNKDVITEIKNIPDNTVDLIVTDPPYKLVSGGMTNNKVHMQRELNPYTVFSNKGTIFKTPKIEEWIFEYFRILKDGSYAFIFMCDRQIGELITLAQKAGFFYCQLLVMEKQNKVANPYYFKQAEFILLFRKGKYKKFPKHGTSNIFEVKLNRGCNKLHPTEKPVWLMEKFIFDCSNEGDLVFDGFAGSATTLLAAKNLNRNYLGYEIEKEYYDIGLSRLHK